MNPAYVYSAQVHRVIDADTLELDIDLGFRAHMIVPVRLLGIDCPELSTPEGKEAKNFVIGLLGHIGGNLTVRTKKDVQGKDEQTFARWLGDVWLSNDQLLADVLKEHGYTKRVFPNLSRND